MVRYWTNVQGTALPVFSALTFAMRSSLTSSVLGLQPSSGLCRECVSEPLNAVLAVSGPLFLTPLQRVRYLIHLYLLLCQNWPCHRKVPLWSHNPCLMVFLLIGQTKWEVILCIRRLFTAEIIELAICYQADLPLLAVWLCVSSFTSLNFVFFPTIKWSYSILSTEKWSAKVYVTVLYTFFFQ